MRMRQWLECICNYLVFKVPSRLECGYMSLQLITLQWVRARARVIGLGPGLGPGIGLDSLTRWLGEG